MDAAKVLWKYKKAQSLFSMITMMQLGELMWKGPCIKPSVQDGASYDFIIVGGGTAGCVIATRLAELGNVKVLLIEAGGVPPFDASLTGYNLYLEKSKYDWNYTSTQNSRTGNHLKNQRFKISQGKVLGGSGLFSYMLYAHGKPYDFDRWASITNDSSWSWKEILPIYRRSEQQTDPRILNSQDSVFYGKSGKIRLTKYYSKRSQLYLNALKEQHKIVNDFNANNINGYSNAMFAISDGVRQSTIYKFLRDFQNNSTLDVLTDTLVTKILINKKNVAVGVEIMTKNNKRIQVKAKKEVIVTAGTVNSPQLLMLSGIGPKKHLEKKGIKVKANLPVGTNLQDNYNTILVYRMGEKGPCNDYRPSNSDFSYPVLIGYSALNNSQKYSDYQTIATISNNAKSFYRLCILLYNFKNEICDSIYKMAGGKEVFFVIHKLLNPKSKGRILLNSADPLDDPKIITGYYSNENDLIRHAKYVKHCNRVLNTTYFKSVKAKLLIPKLKECNGLSCTSDKFWRCYVLNMISKGLYYVGTCAMTKVVDPQLKVYGVKNLRVADASVMINIVGAPIQATVVMIAQKAADMIIEDNDLD